MKATYSVSSLPLRYANSHQRDRFK